MNWKCFCLTVMLYLFCPIISSAESWVQFHADKWSYKSSRAGKKLRFSTVYSYDADSVNKTKTGDVKVWVMENSGNDRYYVGKGAAENEVIHKYIYLWCGLKKYEIITDMESEGGENPEMAEVIPVGSLYEKLSHALCTEK